MNATINLPSPLFNAPAITPDGVAVSLVQLTKEVMASMELVAEFDIPVVVRGVTVSMGYMKQPYAVWRFTVGDKTTRLVVMDVDTIRRVERECFACLWDLLLADEFQSALAPE